MKLYIKNMVCNRCISAVKQTLDAHSLPYIKVDLGEIDLREILSQEKQNNLNLSLKNLGFELIDDKKSKLIEKIKSTLINYLFRSESIETINLTNFLANTLNYDYHYLSNLFSETEGTTIEQYFIRLKIEKVKELLVYDELNLSEISYKLGYSSVAHLSNQFKKVTGLTPTFFKSLKDHKRKNIDELNKM
jgi:AraC-like DNA-binding protein